MEADPLVPWLLATKLGLYASSLIALGLGAFNRLRLTQAIANGRDGGRKALKRTLLTELVVFATALLLVGIATTVTGPTEAC